MPDITCRPWYTAAYPHRAPDAPETCEICGKELTLKEQESCDGFCWECMKNQCEDDLDEVSDQG